METSPSPTFPRSLKLLVTGGAGYIGSTVSHFLLNHGHKVTILDNLSTGYRNSLSKDIRLRVGDFADRRILDELLPQTDAVLHFAASIEVGRSMQNPLLFFQNNTAKTLELLHSMVEHNVTRFVFSSTAAVYGNPSHIPVDEEHPTAPQNPYGESKLMVERILPWLHSAYGLRYATLRYFNAAGGFSGKSVINLIPLLLEVASGERSHLEVYGTDYPTPDGTAIRDYIHIEDLASAHILALDALSDQTQVICNLGNGIGFTVKEVIQATREVTGHPIPIIEVARRAGDPAKITASSLRAHSILGWSPSHTSLKSIISSAWEAKKSQKRDKTP